VGEFKGSESRASLKRVVAACPIEKSQKKEWMAAFAAIHS
jgi:hypothetical protein